MPDTKTDTLKEHPFYVPTVNQLGVLKTGLGNFQLPAVSPETLAQNVAISDISKLVKSAVLHYLERKILPRDSGEKERILGFVEESASRIAKRAGVTLEKTTSKKKQKAKALELDKEEVRASILGALGYYHQVLMNLVNLPKATREETEKDFTPETITSIVEMAARKALGSIGKNQVILDTVEEIVQNIAAYQTIPQESDFHKLPETLQKVILHSENFGKGFDGKDLERIGYRNIRKFDVNALELLVSRLLGNDENRNQIIEGLRNFLSSYEGKVHKGMVEGSFGCYEHERQDVVEA